MTLLNLRAQLINHFCHADAFKTSDFASISVDKGLDSHKDGLIRAALDELVFSGLIRPVAANVKKHAPGTSLPAPPPDWTSATADLWILSSPLNAAGQDVHISMGVANGIAETINTWLSANDLPGERVDPMAINEGHIIGLLEILDDVLSTDPDDFNRSANSDEGGGGSQGQNDQYRDSDPDQEPGDR